MSIARCSSALRGEAHNLQRRLPLPSLPNSLSHAFPAGGDLPADEGAAAGRARHVAFPSSSEGQDHGDDPQRASTINPAAKRAKTSRHSSAQASSPTSETTVVIVYRESCPGGCGAAVHAEDLPNYCAQCGTAWAAPPPAASASSPSSHPQVWSGASSFQPKPLSALIPRPVLRSVQLAELPEAVVQKAREGAYFPLAALMQRGRRDRPLRLASAPSSASARSRR